jgi:Family of unknown function (DUF5317)
VFIVYAVPVGLLAGLLLGGRIGALAQLRIRWAWLAVAGFVVQLLIYSEPIGSTIGLDEAVPAIYIASNVVVLAAVLRNLALPGMAVIAAGATCNLVAILANGGYMPTDANALATAGGRDISGLTNSIIVADPALPFLTDIFAIPAWVPLANVFSIGDVLIGAGVAIVIAAAMRATPAPAAT